MNLFHNTIINIKQKKPLIHNITNYVTINDCANVLLACGASPIMADDPLEVEEITALSGGLVINTGTLHERTIVSMIKAGIKANELKLPVILDPVGISVSKFRMETIKELLTRIQFSVIRGNSSEIMSIYKCSQGMMDTGLSNGVDAKVSDSITESNLNAIIEFAREVSKEMGSIIVITGAYDIITDGTITYVVNNGHEMMSKLTGTGCMLSSLIGAFCAANPEDMLSATVGCVCAMGISGEMAYEKMLKEDGGTGSLKVHLIDFISKMDDEMLRKGAKCGCI